MPYELYRVYTASIGYLVYRHVFDESKCSIKEGAMVHKTALFVTENEALDYADYRNRLTWENGSDAVPDRVSALGQDAG